MLRILTIAFATVLATVSSAFAQKAEVLKQQKLGKWGVTPANYSGITHIWGNRYAVVSDKEEASGFRIFAIDIDTVTGKVLRVSADTLRGFRPHFPRDEEGICYFPEDGTLFISGEADQIVMEYDTLGIPTGRQFDVPEMFALKNIQPNMGFEALTYHSAGKRFYTMTEGALPRDGGKASRALRLAAFNDRLQCVAQYAYSMEAPTMKDGGRLHLQGVSAITALPDGRIIVLEREVRIPSSYFGAKVRCRLFSVVPANEKVIKENTDIQSLPVSEFMKKTEIADFTTQLNIQHMNFANYEGMCLGPRLSDGRQTLLLIDDTQAGAGNGLFRLKEHIKVIVL